MDTPFHRRTGAFDQVSALEKQPRVGTPNDAGNLIRFLLLEQGLGQRPDPVFRRRTALRPTPSRPRRSPLGAPATTLPAIVKSAVAADPARMGLIECSGCWRRNVAMPRLISQSLRGRLRYQSPRSRKARPAHTRRSVGDLVTIGMFPFPAPDPGQVLGAKGEHPAPHRTGVRDPQNTNVCS